MDHPVAVLGLEEDVAARCLRTVQDELDLFVGPLLDVVVALVPDGHTTASVLSLRYFALEGGVLEGMVLCMDREMVLTWRFGQPPGEGPGDEDAVTFETEVPVQAPGRAWCSWMTNPGRALRVGVRLPMGSGVFRGFRFAR